MLDVTFDPPLELEKKKKKTPNMIQALSFSAPTTLKLIHFKQLQCHCRDE